jgi:elongation factor G
MGHGGSGKTTLAEAMLLAAGHVSRLGRVEDGNTASDFDEEEKKHQYSISASVLAIEWGDSRINLIDTPGFPDFEGETVQGCAAADAALIAVDASSGVQGGTEVAWERADEAGPLPRAMLVTRLDRENADFQRTLVQLRDRFGNRVVPLALPIGAAADFEGAVDLLSGKARRGSDSGEAPAEMADEIAAAREVLVESVAESDDDLLNKYLEGEEITDDELAAALHAGVASGDVVPVLPVCAVNGVGVHTLLDDVVALLPSPAGREHALEDGSVTTDGSGPLVAEVFKTTVDPFVGQLSFVKVLSGTLKADQNPYNGRTRSTERLGHLFVTRGKEQIELPELVAGDIGVAQKLADTETGDTFVASEGDTPKAPPLPLPTPTYRTALQPVSKGDVDKLSSALHRITAQDPTIEVSRDQDTGETIMTTVGDAQVAIARSRLAESYGVAVEAVEPRVPYRETISGKSKSEYRHKKQSGGHGQYGHVIIEIEPQTRGEGVAFDEKVVGGNVPRQFIPAVEKGVMETLPKGPLAHSPIVDVRVTLLDGSSHSVDSSEMAFKMAASQALKQGILEARPVLLEPVMNLKIRIPSEHLGDVMSDISGKRGSVHGVDPDGDMATIDAEAPLSEVQRYATDLRALTGGRGRFTIEFDRYLEVPAHVQEELLKALASAEENGNN